MDTERLIGLPEDDARELCESHDHRMRVIMRDEEPLMVTCDYVTNRINVVIEDGIVNMIWGLG